MARPHVLVISPGFGNTNRGSFVQTLEGLVQGLLQNGIAVRQWEASSLGDEDGGLPSLQGITAVLLLGPPTGQQWLRLIAASAQHRSIPMFWMLAANSLTLPQPVLGFLKAYPWIQLLTPSRWSARVISCLLVQEKTTGFEAPEGQRHPLVVPHGVEIAPERVPPVTDRALAHAVAGTTGRKGTEELFEAMDLLPDEQLVAYADATALGWVQGLAEGHPNVRVVRAYNGDATPGFWRHETFVQPSRAEGFGLCAVEAWMLGARVIMRSDTGEPLLPGVTHIPAKHGEIWEGGDGAVLHNTKNVLDPLRIAHPTAIADAIVKERCEPAPDRPAPYVQEAFRYAVAIAPFVTKVRETA